MADKKIDFSELPWGFISFIAYVFILTNIVGVWVMQMVTGG
jgi:hypothetical protein